MTPREIIMRAIAQPSRRIDIVLEGYAPLCREIEDQLAAAGYAIVPREPTEAMNIAAVEKLGEINSEIAKRLPDEPVNPRLLLPLVSSKQTAPVWRAMVDAAAKP